jgi:hypothetical protein
LISGFAGFNKNITAEIDYFASSISERSAMNLSIEEFVVSSPES